MTEARLSARRRAASVLIVTAALLLSACASGSGAKGPDSDGAGRTGGVRTSASAGTTTRGAPSARDQAPPQAFDPEPVASLDARPLALSGADGLAFAFDKDAGGIVAYRLDSGDQAWSNPHPDGAPNNQSGPIVAGAAVFGAFATRTPAVGTVEARHAVTVVSDATATGRQNWSTDVAGGPGEAEYGVSPRVVAADEAHVLVSVTGSADPGADVSYLLDARTGKVLWTAPHFTGVSLNSTAVVGGPGDGTFTGRSTADGHTLWQRRVVIGESLDMGRHPDLLPVTPIEGDTVLVDPATGAARRTIDAADHCYFDDVSITVCAGFGKVTAVDVTTARILWKLPDPAAGRTAPSVTAAWHGVVYGEASTPLTLDARTGRDLRADAGVTPTQVAGRYGLAVDPASGQTLVYRAVGG